MPGCGGEQVAEEALGPATGLADNGAKGQEDAEFGAEKQKAEKEFGVVFNHAAEFGRIRFGVVQHCSRRPVGEVEVRGGSVLVADAEQGEADTPGFEPIVGWGVVAEIIAEADFPVCFRFDGGPAPRGVEFTGGGVNADGGDQGGGRVAEKRNGPLGGWICVQREVGAGMVAASKNEGSRFISSPSNSYETGNSVPTKSN